MITTGLRFNSRTQAGARANKPTTYTFVRLADELQVREKHNLPIILIICAQLWNEQNWKMSWLSSEQINAATAVAVVVVLMIL